MIDTEKEMDNPSDAMKFLTTVLLSVDSPFFEACENIETDQMKKIAESASYVAVYSIAHDIKKAARNIRSETLRSQNPAKQANGRNVAGALDAIGDTMLPEMKTKYEEGEQ